MSGRGRGNVDQRPAWMREGGAAAAAPAPAPKPVEKKVEPAAPVVWRQAGPLSSQGEGRMQGGGGRQHQQRAPAGMGRGRGRGSWGQQQSAPPAQRQQFNGGALFFSCTWPVGSRGRSDRDSPARVEGVGQCACALQNRWGGMEKGGVRDGEKGDERPRGCAASGCRRLLEGFFGR